MADRYRNEYGAKEVWQGAVTPTDAATESYAEQCLQTSLSLLFLTQKDLDALSGVLLRMSPEALLSLKEADIWWLPDLSGSTPAQAVTSIRVALEAFNSRDACVFCIAWLYCCLAERRAFSAWRAYRVDPAGVASRGHFILHERLASALRYLGCHTMAAKIESRGRIYACVMATHPEFTPLEHDVICLCVVRDTPRIFVNVVRNQSRIDVALVLQSLLRRDRSRMPGDYVGELRFSYSAAPERSCDVSMGSGSGASDELGPILDATADRHGRLEPDKPFPKLKHRSRRRVSTGASREHSRSKTIDNFICEGQVGIN
ncbi:hypothetical protein HPB50_008266 [Hyalomma asiaticum]|uniref:Uncharacterized protein n=1 Tax=Hyalomma asiaticum TaxID=266040 RepID=A0ACB7RTL7_HYAAI|nr:hypothetical protein HPB50_008266 [Hyalomma asiaticum]